MKKTLTINISGIIFNIDEDAYEVLNQYLGRIRDYFSKQEGGDEVYADIEARMAEHLGQRISETKQVITLQDIREVTGIMGDVSDLSGDPAAGTGSPEPGTGAEPSGRGPKRLFRDPEVRILGGVCGGLGAWFRLDPVIFRLLFIILTFSGFGIPVYLILWIITPLAQSPADKLEMHGRPVTVRNMEQSLKREWTQVRGTLQKGVPEVGLLMERLGRAILAILRLAWSVFRVFFGILLIILGMSLLFALLTVLFGWFGPLYADDHDIILSLPALIQTFIGKGLSPGLVMMTLLVFTGIPLLLLLYSGLRMSFRIPKIPYAGMTAFNVWLISLFMMIYLGFRISSNYRVPQTVSQKDTTAAACHSDTIYLALDEALADSLGKTGIVTSLRDPGLWVLDDRSVLLRPELSVIPSDDSLVHLSMNVFARGKSPSDALKNARGVKYRYAVKDSLFTFDPVALLPEKEPWQARNIRLRLSVPEGRVVCMDSSVYRILDRDVHEDSYWMAGKKYRMTSDGLEEIR